MWIKTTNIHADLHVLKCMLEACPVNYFHNTTFFDNTYTMQMYATTKFNTFSYHLKINSFEQIY